MNYHLELFRRLLPWRVLGGAVVSIVQLMATRPRTRKAAHQERQIREQIIALNAFISSMTPLGEQSRLPCDFVRDAVQERTVLLDRLARLKARSQKRPRRVLAATAAQRLFLLYPPPRPVGWALRWIFFTLSVHIGVGVVDALFHANLLPMHTFVRMLIVSSSVALVVRLVAFWLERPHIMPPFQSVSVP